jgi:hypothetical protein
MTLKCSRCKASNPDGKRFCAECGGPLDPAFAAMKEFMSSTLREQVSDVLREHYKEQKVIEVETSQAIATRFAEWAKLLAFFLGIPIALLLLLLGAIGIKTYSDFSNQIQKAQSEVVAKLDNAQKLAVRLQSDGAALAGEYERLSGGLANTKALALQVETLAGEYEKLAAGLDKTKVLADRVEVLDKKIVNIAESVRSALVLGNDRYPKLPQSAQLLKAVNDARAVGDAMEGLGFKVMRGENLSREETLQRLRAFTSQFEPGDTAFIFYSGHGVAVAGQNYLLPSDFSMTLADDLQIHIHRAAIAEAELITAIQASKARAAVVVIDACRNSPFEPRGVRSFSVVQLEPKPIDEGQGIFVLYSAGYGQSALDVLREGDKNPNSVFTRVLVPALKKPGLHLTELALSVREQVSRLAKTVGHEQTPAFYDMTTGRVFLAGRNAPTR